MPEYWVSEVLTWKIYADTQEEAQRIWRAYLDGEAPDTGVMKLKGIEHETDWE